MPRSLFWRLLLLIAFVSCVTSTLAIAQTRQLAGRQTQSDGQQSQAEENADEEAADQDDSTSDDDEGDDDEAEDQKESPEKETKTDDAEKDEKSSKEETNADDKKTSDDVSSKKDDEKDADEKADDKKADGDEKEDKESKKEEKKRKTLTLKPKELKIEVVVSGTVTSETMNEIELDAESWTTFEIEEVVEHGAKVRAGQTLIRFDPEELDEALADLELSQRLTELSLTKMEEELPRDEEELKRRLKDAERSWEEEQEDYDRYLETERELVVQSQEMRLKQSKFSLDYAKDEYDQLKKMYESDDLTEETEELILRRSKTELEFARFSYEIAQYNHEVVMNASLPRQDEQLKQLHRRVELALERLKSTTDIDIRRARYELEQARNARRKSLERHSDLTADKGLMLIKSPANGVVYYGRCINGRWGEISSMKQKLIEGKKVSRGTLMMTIVDPDELCVLATLNEKDLPSVKAGQPVELELTAEGVDPIDGKVSLLDRVPSSPGKFDLVIKITGDRPDWLLPGMTGKAKIVTYEKKKALLVPVDAVHTEDEDSDDESKYVWLVDKDDDTVTKREVKTGKTEGKQVEIVDGLEAGDVVSLEKDEKGKQDDKSADGEDADESAYGSDDQSDDESADSDSDDSSDDGDEESGDA